MNELISAESYSLIYYNVMLVLILILFLRLRFTNFSFTNKKPKYFGFLFVLLIIIFIGIRPVNIEFVDMVVYSEIFSKYQLGYPITSNTDVFFHLFTKILSRYVSIELYFIICCFVYIFPMYLFSVKYYKENWLVGFLFLVTSFSFWSYGVNGIRNGIAGSLFILAISRDKWFWRLFWFLIAVNFHKTMLLPIIAYFISIIYNKSQVYLVFWILCIPLSLVAGGLFESLFASSGFGDDRLNYLTTKADSRFSSTGFRWDFLIYSATAVFSGAYLILVKKYNDVLYCNLYNVFLIANSFWILVIRANFSNRFAYLSWFLIGVVIIYPLLNKKILKNQNKKIGVILIIYFMFTYFMNFILKSL